MRQWVEAFSAEFQVCMYVYVYVYVCVFLCVYVNSTSYLKFSQCEFKISILHVQIIKLMSSQSNTLDMHHENIKREMTCPNFWLLSENFRCRCKRHLDPHIFLLALYSLQLTKSKRHDGQGGRPHWSIRSVLLPSNKSSKDGTGLKWLDLLMISLTNNICNWWMFRRLVLNNLRMHTSWENHWSSLNKSISNIPRPRTDNTELPMWKTAPPLIYAYMSEELPWKLSLSAFPGSHKADCSWYTAQVLLKVMSPDSEVVWFAFWDASHAPQCWTHGVAYIYSTARRCC